MASLVAYMTGSRLRVGPQRGGVAGQVVAVNVAEPFPQLVGGAEPEMADLVEALDPHVTPRAVRHQQRPDRFHIAIGGLGDPRGAARQRRPSRLDGVDGVGLAVHGDAPDGSGDPPRPPSTPRCEKPGQAGPVGAGAFHPHPADRPERRQPGVQPANPARSWWNDSTPNTPPLASSAAATCTSKWVSTPPVIGRVLSTMVIAIPSVSNGQGVARTSREGDRDEPLLSTASSITLRNGACRLSPCDRRQTPTDLDDQRVRPNTETADRNAHHPDEPVDPATSTPPYSLGNLARLPPAHHGTA